MMRTVKGLATAIRERPREPGNWAYNIDHEFAALKVLFITLIRNPPR